MIPLQFCLLNLLFHRCLKQITVTQHVCAEGSSNAPLAMCGESSSLGGRDKTLPLYATNFDSLCISFAHSGPVVRSHIISLHQIYPQPHLCVLVRLPWANAAHQPLMYMPAPHSEDLGLADA